jgi:hypothetical protein
MLMLKLHRQPPDKPVAMLSLSRHVPAFRRLLLLGLLVLVGCGRPATDGASSTSSATRSEDTAEAAAAAAIRRQRAVVIHD